MVLIQNLSGPRHTDTLVPARAQNRVRIQIVDDREMGELKLVKSIQIQNKGVLLD